MSLQHKKTSRWWYAVFKLPSGKRKTFRLQVPVAGKRSSVGFAGDAAFLRSKKEAMAEHDLIRGKLFGDISRAELIEEVIRIRSGGDGAELERVKVSEAVRIWERMSVELGRSVIYSRQVVAAWNRFVEFSGEVGFMDEVSTGRVMKYLDGSLIRKSPQTYNSELSRLSAFFGCVCRGQRNPFSVPRRRRARVSHRMPLEEAEVEAILVAAPDWLRPVFLVALSTGMRQADCAKLKWSAIDEELGFVMVRTRKSAEVIQVPVFSRLREVLAELPRGDPDDYVFPEAGGRCHWNLSTWVSRTFEAAGIPRRVEIGQGVVGIKDFHSFRTGWVTRALSAGVPMEFVRLVTGHRTVDVVLRHYFKPGRKAFEKALRRAFD